MNKGDVFLAKDKGNKVPPVICVSDMEDHYILVPCDEVPILSWDTQEQSGVTYIVRKCDPRRVRVDKDKEDEFLTMVDLAK